MTSARIKSAPADGHGLTSSVCDDIWLARQRGENTDDIVAVVVLRPVGTAERDTAQGTHRSVQFEAIRLEPLNGDADRLRMVAEDAYQARTGNRARTLPLNFGDRPDEEQRLQLIEAIDAWSEQTGTSGADIDERWRSHFGVGQGASEGVAGTYEKGSPVQLLEFATAIGAVAGDEPDVDSEPADIEDDEQP